MVVPGGVMSPCYLLIFLMQIEVTWCRITTGAEEKHELVYCVPAQVYSERVCISSYGHMTDKNRDQSDVVVRRCLSYKQKIAKGVSLFWILKGAVGIGGNLASNDFFFTSY